MAHSKAVTIQVADPFSSEAHFCIQSYFSELQGILDEGFDPNLTVSANPDELLPPSGYLLLARMGTEAVGCGALKIHDNEYGEIKRMWVAQPVRGTGVAQRLLEALEAKAALAGVSVLRLDTNGKLHAAIKLYERNGYVEISAYNNNPYAHHWFEKRIC